MIPNDKPTKIKTLDLGVGPGTWSLRLFDLFTDSIDITGIDISEGLLELARSNISEYEKNRNISTSISLKVSDLNKDLPFDNNTFDLTICTNTPLNHIRQSNIESVVSNMLRVTKSGGYNITSVKSEGSLPTVYVCPMSDVLTYTQENDILSFTHKNGQKARLISNLFTLDKLKNLFGKFGKTEFIGVGIFLPRFETYYWPNHDFEKYLNPVMEELEALEKKYSKDSRFIDLANHIMVITKKD